jgi:hypothetical protein
MHCSVLAEQAIRKHCLIILRNRGKIEGLEDDEFNEDDLHELEVED